MVARVSLGVVSGKLVPHMFVPEVCSEIPGQRVARYGIEVRHSYKGETRPQELRDNKTTTRRSEPRWTARDQRTAAFEEGCGATGPKSKEQRAKSKERREFRDKTY